MITIIIITLRTFADQGNSHGAIISGDSMSLRTYYTVVSLHTGKIRKRN